MNPKTITLNLALWVLILQKPQHTYILTDANICLKQPQIQSLSSGNKQQDKTTSIEGEKYRHEYLVHGGTHHTEESATEEVEVQ